MHAVFQEPLVVQTVLRQILQEHDGLTVGQIYTAVQEHRSDPVVQHYLSLEFPHTPIALQNVISVSLLQMGYEVRGPRRKKRFYQPERQDQTHDEREFDEQIAMKGSRT